MFQIFPILFFFMFFLILGVFLFLLVRGIREWNRNNHFPRLTVEAYIVAKRFSVSHHHSTNQAACTGSTSYYATFEVASGDRMELSISASEYGLLAEGDRGNLTFQGTRFLAFDRFPTVTKAG